MATMKVSFSPKPDLTSSIPVRHGHDDGGNMDNRKCTEPIFEHHKGENCRDQGHWEAGDKVQGRFQILFLLYAAAPVLHVGLGYISMYDDL